MADFQTELEQFRVGLRQRESGGSYTVRNSIGAGGAYQYMPGTWKSWAGPALASQYPEAWMAPPAIQDEVARRNMTALYQKFGDWNSVAQAWLAGPGGVGKHLSDGSVTTDQYAAQVLQLAGLSGAGSPADMSARRQYMDSGRAAGDTPTADPTTTPVNPDADRHDLGNQLSDFLSMLDGVGTTASAGGQQNPSDVVQQRMAAA